MQTLDRFRGRTEDVDEALVDLHFEGFAAGFINMWRFDHGESAALSRQRDWARDASTGANRGVDNLASALVDHAVIVSFEADADSETFILFCFCHFVLSTR